MSKIVFDSLNIPISDLVKNYSPELQRDIFEYLVHLDEHNLKAYQIAYDHLGLSFNIARCNGFKTWKKVLDFLRDIDVDIKKNEYKYNDDYVFDCEEIMKTKLFKDWVKTH